MLHIIRTQYLKSFLKTSLFYLFMVKNKPNFLALAYNLQLILWTTKRVSVLQPRLRRRTSANSLLPQPQRPTTPNATTAPTNAKRYCAAPDAAKPTTAPKPAKDPIGRSTNVSARPSPTLTMATKPPPPNQRSRRRSRRREN